jgi:hypothetical protein
MRDAPVPGCAAHSHFRTEHYTGYQFISSDGLPTSKISCVDRAIGNTTIPPELDAPITSQITLLHSQPGTFGDGPLVYRFCVLGYAYRR